jgi:predicted O-methyltransferase YrrM
MKDYTWKPSWCPVIPENHAHPHCPQEKSELFEVYDGGATEYEVLNFLHACIRVLKPQLVIETGAYEGLGTIALAHACKLNGFGKVHSIENDPKACVRVQTVLEEEKLLPWAEVFLSSSLDFIAGSNNVYDIGFFDSLTSIRPIECEMLMNESRIKKLAVFHDTSPYRSITAPDWTSAEEQKEYREKIFNISQKSECSGFYDSPLSRGFIALWLRG